MPSTTTTTTITTTSSRLLPWCCCSFILLSSLLLPQPVISLSSSTTTALVQRYYGGSVKNTYLPPVPSRCGLLLQLAATTNKQQQDDTSNNEDTLLLDKEMYLKQCINEWNHLKTELVDENNNYREVDEEIVEAMIEKAIDAVDTKLDIEMEHEDAIINHLMELESEERTAEINTLLAHDETKWVEDVAKLYKKEWTDVTDDNNPRDIQLRRWLDTIVNAAHILEEDSRTQYMEIHNKADQEVKHLLDEEIIIDKLEEEEMTLKGILVELHQLYRNRHSNSKSGDASSSFQDDNQGDDNKRRHHLNAGDGI